MIVVEYCECGCPRILHQTVPIAVELTPRPGGPLYKIPSHSGIACNDGPVTRFTERCSGCGCMSYQFDHARV